MNATADWQEVKSESQLSLKISSSACVCARVHVSVTMRQEITPFSIQHWGLFFYLLVFFNHIN